MLDMHILNSYCKWGDWKTSDFKILTNHSKIHNSNHWKAKWRSVSLWFFLLIKSIIKHKIQFIYQIILKRPICFSSVTHKSFQIWPQFWYIILLKKKGGEEAVDWMEQSSYTIKSFSNPPVMHLCYPSVQYKSITTLTLIQKHKN